MPRNRSRNRNKNKNKSKKNKNKPFPPRRSIAQKKSKKSKSKESLAKKRKRELEKAARELNLIPRNINHPDKKLVLPQQNKNNNKNTILPIEQLNFNNGNMAPGQDGNQGHNVKRMISSKMYSSKGKNGKDEMVVDILSGITKDKKSRVLRHFKVSKKGKTQYSTVLAKSDGKNIKVLESLHNGNQEKMRKFMVSKPDELKEVFNVQSNKIKGNNVVKSFHLNKGKDANQNNAPNNQGLNKKASNHKATDNKFSKFKIEKKTKQKFNSMRKALRNSIQSIVRARPFEKKPKKHNKFRRSKKRKKGKKK